MLLIPFVSPVSPNTNPAAPNHPLISFTPHLHLPSKPPLFLLSSVSSSLNPVFLNITAPLHLLQLSASATHHRHSAIVRRPPSTSAPSHPSSTPPSAPLTHSGCNSPRSTGSTRLNSRRHYSPSPFISTHFLLHHSPIPAIPQNPSSSSLLLLILQPFQHRHPSTPLHLHPSQFRRPTSPPTSLSSCHLFTPATCHRQQIYSLHSFPPSSHEHNLFPIHPPSSPKSHRRSLQSPAAPPRLSSTTTVSPTASSSPLRLLSHCLPLPPNLTTK